MNYMADMRESTLPRTASNTLDEHLSIMPVVIVTGARQTGKSTLAQKLTTEPRRFVSLDNLDTRDIAQRDPDALIGIPEPITIDEVQRVASLLEAVKSQVDRDRRTGKFLLTGSANLLLMRNVSETLAGRASYITLRPMTRREQLGIGSTGIWGRLIDAPEDEWLDVFRSQPDNREDWRALALRGGFPVPAIELKTNRQRAVWFEGYVRTYLERDLLELSVIANLADFRRLMRATALRVGSIANQSDLGRDVAISQPSVSRWLNLLETSYLLVRVPAYAVNRTKRLVKSPKFYWGDTGVALHLAQVTEPEGAHFENVVLNDILAWRDSQADQSEVFHWRTSNGAEVDFVIESRNTLLPIEVKATTRPRYDDARHLGTFRNEYGERAKPGLVIHDGERLEWLTSDALAIPWWRIM